MVAQDPSPPIGLTYRADRWVIDRSGNLGYLGASAHTFIGRFSTWWGYLGAAYSTSLSDLVQCSPSSAAWLEGFLNGSEPPHWFGDDFDHDEEDPRTAVYWEALKAFRITGVWRPDRSCEVCGAELLRSAPVGLRCTEHGGQVVSNWPKVLDHLPSPHQPP